MNLQEFTPEFVPWARIKVIWVGWAWVNSINRMIQEGVEGVEFVAVNTDAQALANSLAQTKLNIGLDLTHWLGAGANPEIGRKAAEESIDEIKKVLEWADMVFITAWMWWGTGTGAAPVISQLAKEMDILTVGVVTKPFSFEGRQRLQNAIEGLEKMRWSVDSLIVIPNDKIFNIIDKKTKFKEAFSMIDKILMLGVQGISDLIIKPGLVNVDFADVKVIMKDSGTALLGIGYWEGENRSVEAARRAIDNPLLDTRLEGAKSILFVVTWWEDLTPVEVQEAAKVIEEIKDEDANVIWGMSLDPSYEGEVKITIIATWFPESTQDDIIKGTPKFLMGGGVRRSKGEDFVTKAVASSNKPAPTNSQPKMEDDLETPAFLRKKLR